MKYHIIIDLFNNNPFPFRIDNVIKSNIHV